MLSDRGNHQTKSKKCKSKYPTDPVSNLCQIMASRNWNPRLEHAMKLAGPTLNHDTVMKFLGKGETAKHAYFVLKWVEKTGFKHNKLFSYLCQ